MIPVEEVKKIKNDFDEVIRHSQDIEDPQTDRVFAEWQTAKEYFYNAFGGKLIYEYPEKVQFELDNSNKRQRIMSFISSIDNIWGYDELADFISKQEDGFYKNITTEDYTTREGKSISKGTKLVKAFKYFVNNEKALTDIQNAASRIIQENKVEGTLCLSIHPLDYLSISETTYNWRSCHSLDGEYRAGNLSYMMDETTIVCYLKSDKDVKLPRFPESVPWNSKKWRVLLFFSSDKHMIFAGRHYPFESKAGIDLVLNEVLEAANLICTKSLAINWSQWNKVYYPEVIVTGQTTLELVKGYVPIGEELLPLSSVVKDVKGSKHYNDLLYSSTYRPFYAVETYAPFFGSAELMTNKNTTHFNIGAKTYCLRCGEYEIIGGAESMLCEDCELKYGNSESEIFDVCDICGERFYRDEGYSVDNEVICERCFDAYCFSCESCGEVHFKENNMYYNEKTDEYLCEYCYREIEEEDDV